jgi:hypothetical protein
MNPPPIQVSTDGHVVTVLLSRPNQVEAARELTIQRPQFASQNFREGVAAAYERRLPVFTGH